LDLLDRRLVRLRGAVKRGEGSTHIANTAEKVRLAALAVIKAEQALIAEYPQRDPTGRQSRNLQDEEQRWLTLTTDAIVEEHGKDATPKRSARDCDRARYRCYRP
jgi:hypothetical protein